MVGLPVTIRLLDPPLHEFLPKTQADMEQVAKDLGVDLAEVEARAHKLHEFNPMLGHRGVRLGISFPEIYEMQARAIFEAVAEVQKKAGKTVIPEIMIPLIATKKELDLMKVVVDQVAAEVSQMSGQKLEYLVGTMIELPRAALRAAEIAETAEFFSFGTNDLTQTTFGLSRDDSASFLEKYQERGILEHDPFASLDVEGVGELIKIATERGRKTRPDAQARHLRRAWRRSGLGVLLPQGRARLRVLLALSRADRAAGGGAGGAGRSAQDGMSLSPLRQGGKRALASALADLERDPDGPSTQALLDAAWREPRAHVVGVTGPPGVGKSSLCSALVASWRKDGKTVGVIAVDPSSKASGGALLGDRVRIVADAADEGSFVRSMAARDRLGGLADQTLAAMVVMRALFDRVLIETVGVGQSETDVAGVADTVVFCVQPGSGDSLQFMKAGIVEIPHLIVVTKADLGAAAERARTDVAGALSLATTGDWPLKTLAVSSRSGAGVEPGPALGPGDLSDRKPFTHVPYFFSDVFDLSYELWGDSEGATQTITRGDANAKSLSTWWLKNNELIATFTMNRPDEEREAAPEWIKNKQKLNSDRLADQSKSIKEAAQ